MPIWSDQRFLSLSAICFDLPKVHLRSLHSQLGTTVRQLLSSSASWRNSIDWSVLKLIHPNDRWAGNEIDRFSQFFWGSGRPPLSSLRIANNVDEWWGQQRVLRWLLQFSDHGWSIWIWRIVNNVQKNLQTNNELQLRSPNEAKVFVAYWPLEVLKYLQPPPPPVVLLGVITSFWSNSISANNEIDYWVVSASVVSLPKGAELNSLYVTILRKVIVPPPRRAIHCNECDTGDEKVNSESVFNCIFNTLQVRVASSIQSVCMNVGRRVLRWVIHPSVHHQFTSFSVHFQCN